MSSDEEASWKEVAAALLAYAALGLIVNQLYQRFLAPVVWIRKGDPQTALRVVEIVAILLPLLAIFFQILFRRADKEQSPLQNRVDDLLPTILISFFGLFIAGATATLVALFGGVGIGVGVALSGLLLTLVGLLGVVVTFADVVEGEYGIRGEQQRLGGFGSETEPTDDPGESE